MEVGMKLTRATKKIFISAGLLLAASAGISAADDNSVAARGGGERGGGERGGGYDRGGYNHGDQGRYYDNRHNENWGGGYGDGGYAAPAYPYSPYYAPVPTPNEAFPDDAQENSIYQQNQHPPRPQ